MGCGGVGEPARGTHGRGIILGADALVHAGLIVVAAEQITEGVEQIAFRALRQILRPVGLGDQHLRTLAITLTDQHTRERQLAAVEHVRGDRGL